MRTFYPPIEPYRTLHLPVSSLHTIYVEEVGNPDGIPIVFVHGGPGGGVDADHRRYFDPAKWRIILFDQRGCGKSTPYADLRENTTWDLVADMEKIRAELGIDKWYVFGGSWGSTLALAYAESHPGQVLGLILRGIFLVRDSEIKWFYQFGASEIYPDEWDKYLAPIPEAERGDLLHAYYRRLTSNDPGVLNEAALAWSTWEGSTSKLLQNKKFIDHFGEATFAQAFARIEAHYFVNKGFFKEDGWLLKNIDAIRHIKAVIVQGRYDMPCPARSAWDLHKAWPEAQLIVIPDAGHAASEPGTMHELISATDRFAEEHT